MPLQLLVKCYALIRSSVDHKAGGKNCGHFPSSNMIELVRLCHGATGNIPVRPSDATLAHIINILGGHCGQTHKNLRTVFDILEAPTIVS